MDNVTVEQVDRFLILKRGLYFRPDNCGYTGLKREAGRYPASRAYNDSGETAIHEDEAPEYSPACWEETKLADKDRQIAELTARLASEQSRSTDGEVGEWLDLAHDLIQEAKGAECLNGGFVTNHLDAAENALDKIEQHFAVLTTDRDQWKARAEKRGEALAITPIAQAASSQSSIPSAGHTLGTWLTWDDGVLAMPPNGATGPVGELVERLRTHECSCGGPCGQQVPAYIAEAASALSSMQARIEKLSSLGLALIEACDGMIEDTNGIFAEMELARGRPYTGRQIGKELEAFRQALEETGHG